MSEQEPTTLDEYSDTSIVLEQHLSDLMGQRNDQEAQHAAALRILADREKIILYYSEHPESYDKIKFDELMGKV